MQFRGLACVCLSACLALGAASASPIDKVLQLISDLQAKVVKEGEEAQKVFAEYSEWCEDRARNLDHEIKTGTSQVASLKASIAKEVAEGETLTSKIEQLASGIATDEADLKAATEIRSKEGADFASEEKELMETISVLERAIGILEKEMAKGGASMLQTHNAKSLAQALSVLVDASAISSADAGRLTAFVQSSQTSDDEDMDAELGAPAAAMYEGHSGDIIETLQGLLDKAEQGLDDSRKKETSALHNFEMLKQSLQDEVKFGNKDLDEAKKSTMARGKLVFKGEEKAKKKKSSKKKKIVGEGLSSANGGEAVVCGAANVSGSTQQLDAVEVAPNHDVSRGDGLARSDNNPEKSEGPKIMSGEGLITTSATVVSGHNRTAFKTELRVGDAILARTQTGTEEMRVITMVLSQVSISISSAFSTNISTPTAFRYINKPRNDKKEKAIKAEKARQEKEEVEERAMGTYGNKGEIIYREKTEHGGYRIRKEQATKKMSRSDLLSVRATKKSDRYC